MLRPSMSGGSSALRRSRKVGAFGQQLVDQRPVGFLAGCRAAASAYRTCARRGSMTSSIRRSTSSGRGRLRREIRRGRRGLRARDAFRRRAFRSATCSADRATCSSLAPAMFALRQQPLLVDEAVEIGRCHGPAVALVFDKGMDDRDRARLCRRLRPVRRCRAAPACWQSPRLRSGSGRPRSRD